MSFRVAARTILHLGSELISSDSIAFYELIKNAFDARSPRVVIDITIRCPGANELRRAFEQLATKPASAQMAGFKALQQSASRAVDKTAPNAASLTAALNKASTCGEACAALRTANEIKLADSGVGMSLEDLRAVFLTIGTNFRRVERQNEVKASKDGKPSRPILGEKGVGRLSAMRLGSLLEVTTSKKGEKRWNVLAIDWERFSHDSEEWLEDVAIEPTPGEKKTDSDEHGTTIRINSLHSAWTKDKLVGIVKQEFAKLTDPFSPKSRYPITLRFNGDPVVIPSFNATLFEHAHAVIDAQFEYRLENGQLKPFLVGSIDYLLHQRKKTFSLSGEDLISLCRGQTGALSSLGPFAAKMYWYNRRILEALEGIGDKRAVQKLVNQWSGGFMLFRDGFRVQPYGSADDDWLDLDSQALASSGYKVNRKQLIGKVDISSIENPGLVDQTNREGLKDCPEKDVLVALLKYILEDQFRFFINSVDKEAKLAEPVDLDKLRGRVMSERKQVKAVLAKLVTRYPAVKKDAEIVPMIEDSLEKIEGAMNDLERIAENYDEKESTMLHLAGIGMMVEILAHELWRATRHALETLSTMEEESDGGQTPAIRTLETQLRTLQKRLQVLDPVNTTTRQVKHRIVLYELLRDVVLSHRGQFDRHHIEVKIHVEPSSAAKIFEVKMVPGMVVQVLENLLNNSVYWLKQKNVLDEDFKPRIDITLDTKKRELLVTDNGPGVDPARREEIFGAFVTTKPPGEGKGLGLYISREIAKYHGGKLTMADAEGPADNRLRTFVLSLPK